MTKNRYEIAARRIENRLNELDTRHNISHCKGNRAKRMRDARLHRSLTRYQRLSKVFDILVKAKNSNHRTDFDDFKYLFQTTHMLMGQYKTRCNAPKKRMEEIKEWIQKNLPEDCSYYDHLLIILNTSRGFPFDDGIASADELLSTLNGNETAIKIIIDGRDDSLNTEAEFYLVASKGNDRIIKEQDKLSI